MVHEQPVFSCFLATLYVTTTESMIQIVVARFPRMGFCGVAGSPLLRLFDAKILT